MSKKTIKIQGTNYPVFIGDVFELLNDGIAAQKYSTVFILTDENTNKLCLPLLLSSGFQHKLINIQIPSGESSKTLQTAEFVWKKLMREKADRNSVLINLGGGTVTDLGGFVAATYKRGIDFIHVPTTLLCMADACVGGKTGVDFQEVKNAIGVIKNPQAVFIYPGFLKTLPADEYRSGLAEIIKHGLIEGKKTWKDLVNDFKNQKMPDISNEQLAATLKIKLSVVKQDAEEKSIRRVLNFGHTVGHALESWLLGKGMKTYHGYCVAAGMITELYLSEHLAGLNEKQRDETVTLIKNIFPKIDFSEEDIPLIIEFMEQDKKNSSGKIGFVLMKKPGELLINRYVSKEKIKEALDFYRMLQ